MNERKYLNEENYQRTEKKLAIVSVIILIIGLCIGGFLIYKGFQKPEGSNLDELKAQLETKRKELEAKGITYSEFARYTDGEKYDLKIVTNALDPSFNNCAFDEYKENSLTKDYCAAKNTTKQKLTNIGLIIWGLFICISTCMASGMIFLLSKRRKILAFQVQQVMPVAKEGIEEMAPTFGKAANEITKGIKKGLDESKK